MLTMNFMNLTITLEAFLNKGRERVPEVTETANKIINIIKIRTPQGYDIKGIVRVLPCLPLFFLSPAWADLESSHEYFS